MTETTPIVRMGKARQDLVSSRMLLQAGDSAGACNRAYYAMFYAAHCALDAADVIAPGAVFKTHHGLITIFSKKLVLTGEIDTALGRSLSKVYDMRLLADYQDEPLEESDALWASEQARLFVEAIEVKYLG